MEMDIIKNELNSETENTVELKSKCGEVFVTKTGQISCYCLLCQCDYDSFLSFSNHIIDDHLGLDFTNDFNELKANQNYVNQVNNVAKDNYCLYRNCVNKSLYRAAHQANSNNCNSESDSININNFSIFNNQDEQKYSCESEEQTYVDLAESLENKSKLLEIEVPIKNEFYFNDSVNVKLYTCSICNRNFQREGALENHKKNHELKLIDCPHCGKCFQKLSLFKSHDLRRCADKQNKAARIVSNEEENVIQIEPETAEPRMKENFSEDLLIKDEKGHETKLNFCEMCTKNFPSKIEYENHLKHSHHNLIEENRKIKKCCYCPRMFQNLINLEKHEERHRQIQNTCEYCGKLFESQTVKYQHLRSHTEEKPFVCSSAFSTRGNLNHHKSTCHSEERPYLCTWPNCEKGFKKDRQRVWHERIHTGEKPYQCEQCGQQFAIQHKLGLHKKQKHLDKKDRPHKCDQCEKAFILPRQLREHKYTHTGQKPHQCDICPARFAKRCGLTEHKKLHTGEKKHVCDICGRAFAQRAGYATHIKSHNLFK